MFKSFYIHIPFCVSKCDYCDFFSIPQGKKNVREDYVKALLNEINLRLEKNGEFLDTVYIGGGTPSLLSDGEIKELCGAFKPYLLSDAEVTIELNPDDITENLLSVLSSEGINRLSTGIQSLSEKALSNVHRRSSAQCNLNALNLIKSNWKGIFSADLISGLPGESERDFIETVKRLLDFSPDHISLYSLTIEEETPLRKRLEDGKLKYDFDKADRIWISAKNFLEENGYIQYEVSNFFNKKKGKPCRHNIAYWNLMNYGAAGSGGTGSFYDFKSGLAFRYTNTKNIQEYINFWLNADEQNVDENPSEKENLDRETLVFEFFMMGLRLKMGVSLLDFKNRFGIPVPLKIRKTIDEWIKKGFASCAGEDMKFSLSEKGFLFLNRFLEEII